MDLSLGLTSGMTKNCKVVAGACAVRNYITLRTRTLPYAAPGHSQFLDRLEHTCGMRAQQKDCHQCLPLSHLLLLALCETCGQKKAGSNADLHPSCIM